MYCFQWQSMHLNLVMVAAGSKLPTSCKKLVKIVGFADETVRYYGCFRKSFAHLLQHTTQAR